MNSPNSLLDEGAVGHGRGHGGACDDPPEALEATSFVIDASARGRWQISSFLGNPSKGSRTMSVSRRPPSRSALRRLWESWACAIVRTPPAAWQMPVMTHCGEVSARKPRDARPRPSGGDDALASPGRLQAGNRLAGPRSGTRPGNAATRRWAH